MTIIRQGSLFALQDLYELEPTHRFEAVFSTIEVDPILAVVSKKTLYGAPVQLNYAAMIYSLTARILERIPTIKDLIKRLKNDYMFRLDCGFLLSDAIPSEASYSRMLTKLEESDVLERVQETQILQAIIEGFVMDDTIAIDATHIEARDQAPAKVEKAKPEPKKRGRKSKEEQEKWVQEQAEREAALSVFEKPIESQLDTPLNELRSSVPTDPKWGIKKNSEGKNAYWFGYKGHLAVGTKSQYILQSLFSSGNLNDGKAAIPLLKGIHERLSILPISYSTLDAGYDYPAIYEQIYRIRAQSIIAYNKKNESEPVGFDKYFAPTCVREHSYRYDSYDPTYETLKYTRPKECKDCPLAEDTLCQKVYKVKITTDLRRYTAPARGSKAWKNLYKQRSAVERVIAYLKEFFQLNNVRYRTGKRAKVHFDLTQLVYNGSKLACDRIAKVLSEKEMIQAA
ncbi:IS1182-like element IS662 family transposase [Halalkalibacterium halodurans]|nr:IS1182-like element IS662 family transposase [Halalkalibacterium halodurans]TES54230.1 IS1182-like element IS662 family transposase [Halalkalibacterium halodurans]TES57757.1 IS1182-like element IS662 family transposase [Halalkalibacterium halodurans]